MLHRGNSKTLAAVRRKVSANNVFQCLISSGPLAVVVDQRTRATYRDRAARNAVHTFRHAMRSRPRAIDLPARAVDRWPVAVSYL